MNKVNIKTDVNITLPYNAALLINRSLRHTEDVLREGSKHNKVMKEMLLEFETARAMFYKQMPPMSEDSKPNYKAKDQADSSRRDKKEVV